MEIINPRRILLLGAPSSGTLTLLKGLTGSAPTPLDSSTAGLSHSWTLKTPYYTAELPIWIDEVPDTQAWREEFMKEEAHEVVRAVGGWVVCFRRPVGSGDVDAMRNLLRAVADVIEKACGYAWDGVCLAVAMPQSTTPYLEKEVEEWEELCTEFGFEYVDAEAQGKNEFGEPMGLARVKEALEANEWAGDEDLDVDSLGLDDEEEFQNACAAEEAEMGMEFMGMKTAVNGGDDVRAALGGGEDDRADQVEELERMMHKMQAIRELGAEMPEAERKRFAAKAVSDLMKKF